MNVSITAGSGAYAFIVLPLVISGISEVFVGQYNGQNEPLKMGKAIWQMIWFSLFMTPIFIFIAKLGAFYFFPSSSDERAYFSIFLYSGFFFCAAQALIGFFAGQGKVLFITIAIAIGNIANIILDLVLIFGFKGIPAMGVTGAIYATVIAQSFIFFTLFIKFLSKKNRKKNGSGNFKIDFKLFKECLQVGFPISIAYTSEIFCNFLFFLVMQKAGKDYLTLVGLVQSVHILIYFIIEGIYKGVAAVSSNLIGAKRDNFINKNVFSAFKLHMIFSLMIFFSLLFYSSQIFGLFFTPSEMAIMPKGSMDSLYKSGLWLAIYFLFDGWAWVITGALTGAKDTKFIMRIGIIAPWLLQLLPVYLGVNFFNISADGVWGLSAIYSLFIFIIYLLRFKSGRWKEIIL